MVNGPIMDDTCRLGLGQGVSVNVACHVWTLQHGVLIVANYHVGAQKEATIRCVLSCMNHD